MIEKWNVELIRYAFDASSSDSLPIANITFGLLDGRGGLMRCGFYQSVKRMPSFSQRKDAAVKVLRTERIDQSRERISCQRARRIPTIAGIFGASGRYQMMNRGETRDEKQGS